MAKDSDMRPRVTDAEIEEIAQQGEAGINDLIAAYAPIEQSYFNAVQTDTHVVTSSSTTTRER